MIKRHTSLFIDELTPLNFCGKAIGYYAKNVSSFELPFEINPTTGEHDFNNCEGCKKNLNELTVQFSSKFAGNKEKLPFPLCCTYHSNLVKVKGFDRVLFTNVPQMVARKIIYTNQHIINNHSSENWYKIITDYIEAMVESFGQMPTGCGEPLYLNDFFDSIVRICKMHKEMPADKQNKLIEFVNSYRTPPAQNEKSDSNDLPVLLSTYEKWIKAFPFELTNYFSNLKEHFKKHLMIVNGKPETNIYTGLTKVKMHTKGSLIEALTTLTNELLNKINAREMVEKKIIPDINRHRFELESESLRIATSQITKDFSKGELKYMKALKKWLQLHKHYFEKITPLLNASTPPPPTETKTEKLKTELNKFGFFNLEKVKGLSDINKDKLVELISTKGLPYSVAMFDYLDYFKHLEREHFPTKYKLNKEVGKWFNINDRAVKGNVSSLLRTTNENKSRYTAYKHIETVKKDYQTLK